MATTILSQSQSTLVGDSFVSMSQSALPVGVNVEEPLLDLWLSQVGREQAESIAASSDLSGPILQLISPQNLLLTLPVFLLDTNQIDLLAQWVELNANKANLQSSLNYLKGVCALHQGDIDLAGASFEGKN